MRVASDAHRTQRFVYICFKIRVDLTHMNLKVDWTVEESIALKFESNGRQTQIFPYVESSEITLQYF